MIDLQAEAEKLAGTDWQTFVGLVGSIRESPSDQTLKLILADWIDEKGFGWNGDSLRWAAEKDRNPAVTQPLMSNQEFWCWNFTGSTRTGSLPPAFYDGPRNRTDKIPWREMRCESPEGAWLWFVVRFSQLREEGHL